MTEIVDFIEKISNNYTLSEQESKEAFELVMSGECLDTEISAFLMSLRTRGETIDEISGAVMAIRNNMLSMDVPRDTIDIVGTGGDGMKTYNISTTTAQVVAGHGVNVAKHGNRSVSSLSGSSDILSELNVNINISPDSALKCLAETNICFLFAPMYHPSFKHVAKARGELKLRTIFNILGPLCNPGNVKKHLIGVYDKKWCDPMSRVLKRLGSENAWLVNSHDGLDEISIFNKTHVTELAKGKINNHTIDPNVYNIRKTNLNEIKGDKPKHNAAKLIKLLDGELNAYRDIVLINSAAAFMVAGVCNNLRDGLELAANSIDSGRAKNTLKKLISISNKLT